MLAGHMDEIGFMVRYIDDNGYLRLNPVGGFDPKTLIAKRVLVRGKSGQKHMGLIGTKPIHIMKPEEAKKMPALDDLFVDMGIPAEDVKAEVEIGTPRDAVADVRPVGGHRDLQVHGQPDCPVR